MRSYDLYMFDLDNTLVKPWTTQFLPGVEEWFRSSVGDSRIGIATNQGSVGLRHWMEVDGFGDPGKYRPAKMVEKDLIDVYFSIREWIGFSVPEMRYCYAYQSKKGIWAPTPEGLGMPHSLVWQHEWRKPSPGMLNDIMRVTRITPKRALFVGDQETDQQAAAAAGCDFAWAHEFFGRELEPVQGELL